MLSGLLHAFVDIVYPPLCLICRDRLDLRDNPANLCEGCLQKIPKNIAPFCQKCGVSLSENLKELQLCRVCKTKVFPFDRAWSACRYTDEMVGLIRLFKYKAKLMLKEIFGKILCEFIAIYHLPIRDCDCLVPIPLHPVRLREREFNQSQVLAAEIAKRYDIRVSLNNLVRIRNTKSQTKLDEKQRFKNIRGAFSLRNPKEFASKNILLIDDLFTTGATVSEAASILKNAGAKRVFVLTLARA